MRKLLIILLILGCSAFASDHYFILSSGGKLKITIQDDNLGLFEAISIQHNQLVVLESVELYFIPISEQCAQEKYETDHIITCLSQALNQLVAEAPVEVDQFDIPAGIFVHHWQGGGVFNLPPTNGYSIATWANSYAPVFREIPEQKIPVEANVARCERADSGIFSAATLLKSEHCIFAGCSKQFPVRSQKRANHHKLHISGIQFPHQCTVSNCSKITTSEHCFLIHVGRCHFKQIYLSLDK